MAKEFQAMAPQLRNLEYLIPCTCDFGGVHVRLRNVRTAVGLTQAQVGAQLKPPQARRNVCKWEKGRCEPSLDTVRQLATILNVEPCWLAWGIEHGE